MIAIVDIGVGNMGAVKNMLRKVKAEAVIVDNPGDLDALTQWFTAAAAVGSSGGSFEFNAAAGASVFHEANAAHNDGFLRDEGAVLAVRKAAPKVEEGVATVESSPS